jgi:hypothetical protein
MGGWAIADLTALVGGILLLAVLTWAAHARAKAHRRINVVRGFRHVRRPRKAALGGRS